MIPMTRGRIVGAVVFAVGAVLLGFAYHSSNAPLEQLSNTLTGRYSDHTMWYLAVGVAAVVGGGLLVMFGARK
jgi:hypothetical protein